MSFSCCLSDGQIIGCSLGVLVSLDSSTDALNNAPKTAFSRGKSSLIILGWQYKGAPASGAETKQGLLGTCILQGNEGGETSPNRFKMWESMSNNHLKIQLPPSPFSQIPSSPPKPSLGFPFIKHLKLDLWLLSKLKCQHTLSKYISKWAVQHVMINGC